MSFKCANCENWVRKSQNEIAGWCLHPNNATWGFKEKEPWTMYEKNFCPEHNGIKRFVLTDEIANALPLPTRGSVQYWDTKLIGFCVSCSSGGSRMWGVQGRILDKAPGGIAPSWKAARQSLGKVTLLPEKVARERAREWLAAAESACDPRPAPAPGRSRSWYKQALTVSAGNSAQHPGLTKAMRAQLRTLELRARARSKKENWPFDLGRDFLVVLYAQQNGRCKLTDLPMILDELDGAHMRRPWAPSVDRIDSSFGYVEDNVQLVCVAANFAKGEWSENVFRTLVTAAARNPFL